MPKYNNILSYDMGKFFLESNNLQNSFLGVLSGAFHFLWIIYWMFRNEIKI